MSHKSEKSRKAEHGKQHDFFEGDKGNHEDDLQELKQLVDAMLDDQEKEYKQQEILEELLSKKKELDKAYYDEDRPIVSDAEYDALIREIDRKSVV